MLKLENWRENILGCHEVVPSLLLPYPQTPQNKIPKVQKQIFGWLKPVSSHLQLKLLKELKIETLKLINLKYCKEKNEIFMSGCQNESFKL